AVRWDPDGPGPDHDILVIGGSFSEAGNLPAHSLAALVDGSWRPLGGGVQGVVYALTVYNGELIVAGDFSTTGAIAVQNIARFNGVSWSSLGQGLNGRVSQLTIYRGQPVAVGAF